MFSSTDGDLALLKNSVTHSCGWCVHQMRGSGLFNGGGLVDFKGQILFQSNGEQDNIYQDDNIDRGVIDIGRGGAIYNADDGVIT